MAYNPDYIHCTICGMVLREDVVALIGPHWPELHEAPSSLKVSDEEVVRYDAWADCYRGALSLLPDGPKLHPQFEYDVDEESDEPSEWVGKMYVGIHAACEDLFNRVIRTSSNTKVRSVGELWLTLERRCARTKHKESRNIGMHFTPSIPNSQPGQPFSVGLEHYYVPTASLYRYGNEWGGWWDEDPIAVPDITTGLIANLEHATELSNQLPGDLAQFRNCIEALPQEVKDHICSFFQHGQTSLECNYLMPQSMWKRVFFQIPFLWDLDAQAVHNKTGLDDADTGNSNWERITRQVMSPVRVSSSDAKEYNGGAWSHEKVGLHVPGGFTNRRRIWQILEEMYPNDVQH